MIEISNKEIEISFGLQRKSTKRGICIALVSTQFFLAWYTACSCQFLVQFCAVSLLRGRFSKLWFSNSESSKYSQKIHETGCLQDKHWAIWWGVAYCVGGVLLLLLLTSQHYSWNFYRRKAGIEDFREEKWQTNRVSFHASQKIGYTELFAPIKRGDLLPISTVQSFPSDLGCWMLIEIAHVKTSAIKHLPKNRLSKAQILNSGRPGGPSSISKPWFKLETSRYRYWNIGITLSAAVERMTKGTGITARSALNLKRGLVRW